MTYYEFRDKYNGQWIDWDGSYGPQCWDLAQKYFTECLELPSWVLSGCGGVKNMLWGDKRNDLNTFFDEIDTTTMQPGDVSIWEEGECGHIAIYNDYDGVNCWYFSQNPNPSQVMIVNMDGHHAFRLRKEEPTPPQKVTPNVEPDKYKNQIEVKEGITELRVRTTPSQNGEIIGKANKGYYNYYEIVDAEDLNWYKIADNQWIAYNPEWENIHQAEQKEEFVKLKILEEKDDYVLVDLGKAYIKK